MKKLTTAIVGASGYSGEELVRLLGRHPGIALKTVTSRSLAGRSVSDVIAQLRGSPVANLAFSASEPTALAADAELDVVFLALPHGVAAEYALPLVEAGKTVIDLSADFRLNDPATYADYYGTKHPAPELLKAAPYVIPELAGEDWKSARLIACPGCYPTSVQLPLVPLLRAGLLQASGIIINSYSGVSGAGKKVAEDYLYAERNESIKAYGIPRHRHLSEIEEQLTLASGKDAPVVVQFNPHLAPLTRGIATTITVPANGLDIDSLYAAWHDAYANTPFVSVLPSGSFPDTRHVANTNRADISATIDARTGNCIITSAIDNLLKGASGQAVQILNLKYGFAETDGLL
jgi:N-acetyl-gamma-glutamyl-phosphate reductase